MNIFQITLDIHIEIHKIFAFFNGWVIYGWNSENKPENQDKKTRERKKIELTNILEKELNQIQNLTLPFSKKFRDSVF